MIPNLAIIVAAYALARLLNEYIITDATLYGLRVLVAIVAGLAVVVGLIGILSAANTVSDLGI